MQWFLNLRLYSWGELVLLVFAVSSLSEEQSWKFSMHGIAMLLTHWAYFNLALEQKHDYPFRSTVGRFTPYLFLLAAAVFSLLQSPTSLFWICIATLCVGLYLQKGKSPLGIGSAVWRGLVHGSYVFAVTGAQELLLETTVLAGAFTLAKIARSLIGDLRDVAHNKAQNKLTVPVRWGCRPTERIVAALLLFSSILLMVGFHNFTPPLYFLHPYFPLPCLPWILLALSVLVVSNHYINHQLAILASIFTCFFILVEYGELNVLVCVSLYGSIILLLVTYPLLPRPSNPDFKVKISDEYC